MGPPPAWRPLLIVEVEGCAMKLLILGGTLFLGRRLVDAARARGHQVALFNRGRTAPDLFPGLERLRGDRDGVKLRIRCAWGGVHRRNRRAAAPRTGFALDYPVGWARARGLPRRDGGNDVYRSRVFPNSWG